MTTKAPKKLLNTNEYIWAENYFILFLLYESYHGGPTGLAPVATHAHAEEEKRKNV